MTAVPEPVRGARRAAVCAGVLLLTAGAGLAIDLQSRAVASGKGPLPVPGTGQGATGNGPGSTSGNDGDGATPPPKALQVTTTAPGPLTPGVDSSITVTVRNLNHQPVVLTEVITTVRSVDSPPPAPGLQPCERSWFQIDDWHGAQHVPKNGSRSLDLPVRLVNEAVNQDSCKRAGYTFDVRATAEQVSPHLTSKDST